MQMWSGRAISLFLLMLLWGLHAAWGGGARNLSAERRDGRRALQPPPGALRAAARKRPAWKHYRHRALQFSLQIPPQMHIRGKGKSPALEWKMPGQKWFVLLEVHDLPKGRTIRQWLKDWGGTFGETTLAGGVPALVRVSLFEAVYEESVLFLQRRLGKIVEVKLVVPEIADWMGPREKVEQQYRRQAAIFERMVKSIRFSEAGEGGAGAPASGPVVEKLPEVSSFEIAYQKIRLRDLTGDGKAELIGALSVRMEEGGLFRHYSYVDVFERIKGAYQHIYRVPVESFEDFDFYDVDGNGTSELVIRGVFGAHGHFLNVVAFKSAWPADLWKEVNPHGVFLVKDPKRGAIVKTGIPPSKPNWSYADPHPWRRYVWSRGRFVFDRVVSE